MQSTPFQRTLSIADALFIVDTTVGLKHYYCMLFKPLNRGHSLDKGRTLGPKRS